MVNFFIHPSLVTMILVALVIGFAIEFTSSKRRKARKANGSGGEES